MIMLQPQAAKPDWQPEAEVTWIVRFLLARSQPEVACVTLGFHVARDVGVTVTVPATGKKISGLKISVAGNWQCGTGGRNLPERCGASRPALAGRDSCGASTLSSGSNATLSSIYIRASLPSDSSV